MKLLKRIQRWWSRNFGSFEEQKIAVYQDLLQDGVGLQARGFYLRTESEESDLLHYLDQRITLAKAPYGQTVLTLQAYPLDEDLKKAIVNTKITRITDPFYKEQWRDIRQNALIQMREIARQSPANAIGVVVFNFGDLVTQAASQMNWGINHR
jgi:uncharacterized protein YbjQ (UPF0145 family)